jgi:hypothetical protein
MRHQVFDVPERVVAEVQEYRLYRGYVFTYPVSAMAKPAPASKLDGRTDHGIEVAWPVMHKPRLARRAAQPEGASEGHGLPAKCACIA